jgi:hypothetical protein
MIRDVCYHDEPCTPEDRLFQITACRTFGKTATWWAVHDVLGRYPVLVHVGHSRRRRVDCRPCDESRAPGNGQGAGPHGARCWANQSRAGMLAASKPFI